SKIGKQYINGFNDKLKELEFSAESLPTRSLPKKYFNFSKSAKLQFLKGIYTANGSVIKAGRVALKSTCRKLVEEISA
ncbi:hypothetical protein M3M33_17450, partial [Loigolactobacillus coryniformis]|uniref:hypothetical protein n=1 Tax=Loigolactobacillus coryniformis TaxID=1610 RepID=UPI00201B2BE2